MSSTIKVNNIQNLAGDDSGIDLSTNDQIILKTANTTALTIDSSQDTTVAGNIKKTGDLTLDVSGDITLDADGGDFIFKDGGSGDEVNKTIRFSTPSHDTDEENVQILQVESESSSNQISFGGGTSALNSATTMRFLTSSVDTTTGTERMRIDSSGRVGIGTIPDSNRNFHIESDQDGAFIQMIEMTGTGAKFGLDIFTSGTQNDDTNSEFIRCRDTGAVRFRVMSNGNAQNANNVYGAVSDIKLKEQITDASSQWEDIKALKVRKYKKKEDVAKGDSDSHWRLGVIAQELETAKMNGLVNNTSDLVEDDDGIFVDSGTVTKSVKYSILYMKAVKALQEAMARIETLEAKVTALEGK